MSLQLINQYYSQVERYIQYGGSRHEQSLRNAFYQLLENYAHTQSLELIAELEHRVNGSVVYPDGTLKDALRQDRGYWESKDQYDDLDEEIDKKFQKGYPNTNILFDDTRQVVLIQNAQEVGRTKVEDAETLNALLTQFVNYEPPHIKTFRDAIESFKNDLPDLLDELRKVIEEQAQHNAKFQAQRDRLLELVQKAINPHLGTEDVREMVIQHILTEEIFTSVFNESQFHRENNIARELHSVTETFFVGALRRNTLLRIAPYYNVIKAAAANIANHHEKQKFLKVVYENFYKAYNPAAADRLGIVYTPNEIVRFMIEAADHLTHKHFGKFLGDEGVNILDPATGTGTFITEIVEYLPKHQLKHKYAHELFCNEVALLPYYTANLNIEYTYQQKMGEYAEFENIAFVDTLENLNYVGSTGQFSMFEMTAENLERIKRQNEKKISVIIGNPPYNALQKSENENNKNRPYPVIDDRLKETYVKYSSAQNKTKLYDMYARFLRWGSDRIGKNGVISYVINGSFINKPIFDGFRKAAEEDFSEIYVVDLGGDVRDNPKLSGPKHNVFAIQTGVAILFLVRNEMHKGKAVVYYARRPEQEAAREKIQWLSTENLSSIAFRHVFLNDKHQWVKLVSNDWENLIPVATKETKIASKDVEIDAIFRLYSLGINTNRDEWVYDFDQANLKPKMSYFLDIYNQDVNKLYGNVDKSTIDDAVNYEIKWSSSLKSSLLQDKQFSYKQTRIFDSMYRPFIKTYLYYGEGVIHRQAQHSLIFSTPMTSNTVIVFRSGQRTDFCALATNYIPDINFFTPDPAQCLPLYRYDEHGNRLDNITNWGLKRFQEHCGDEDITKEDIFHYTYGVLHDPAYRKKYELNLKREFPHIPFYEDFAQWAAWGEALMDLHLNYETVEPFELDRLETEPDVTPKGLAQLSKAKLKADKLKGQIVLDGFTTLVGVPPEAWEYKLGNRSALEWVLDRYKEKKPRDPTIREKFNTYRFADYKEEVIDLLKRVCTVSVKTVKIIREMENLEKIGVEKITA